MISTKSILSFSHNSGIFEVIYSGSDFLRYLADNGKRRKYKGIMWNSCVFIRLLKMYFHNYKECQTEEIRWRQHTLDLPESAEPGWDKPKESPNQAPATSSHLQSKWRQHVWDLGRELHRGRNVQWMVSLHKIHLESDACFYDSGIGPQIISCDFHS